MDFESLTVQFSGTVGNARHPPARALRYAYVTVITSNVTITITLRSESRDYGNGNGSACDTHFENEAAQVDRVLGRLRERDNLRLAGAQRDGRLLARAPRQRGPLPEGDPAGGGVALADLSDWYFLSVSE